MLTPDSRLGRFGRWLRSKRNFYLFSILGVGMPVWALEVWLTREFGSGPGWIVFLGVVSVAGAWVWGFFMWRFFASKYPVDEVTRP